MLASAQAVVARAMAFVEDKDMVTTEDAKQRFKEMCSVVGVGDNRDELPKAAFKDLVKMLMTESGQKELPSDKDLDAAFKLADADKSGLVDEGEFVNLYKVILQGGVVGLGKKSLFSGGSARKQRKTAFRANLANLDTGDAEPPSPAPEEPTTPADVLSAAEKADVVARFAAAAAGSADGELSQEEFKALVLELEPGTDEADLNEAFALADADESGRVDELEFLNLYRLIKKGEVTGLGKKSTGILGAVGVGKKRVVKRRASFKEQSHSLRLRRRVKRCGEERATPLE
jgi:Ca2+-binding EF-hand superfamily protein